MRFDVVTLFPELIEGWLGPGLLGKAVSDGTLEVRCQTPRDFTTDKHRSVDDAPYGGGSGMVMMAPPLLGAIEALDARAQSQGQPRARRILLTPQGAPFRQQDARRLSELDAVMLICGRYEGIDERVHEEVDEQISLGDFVLNGGEAAAVAIIEAVARHLPGMLGNEASLDEESHQRGLLEYPHYTRPREFHGRQVPEVLLSGNHAEIAAFRQRTALQRTRQRRPDLFERLPPELRAQLAMEAGPSAPVYCALLHYPVRDRAGDTVTTAVTTLDVHDIARSAQTYGLRGYFVVSPIEAQHVLVARILEHWRSGAGQRRMPERGEALALCESALSLEQAIERVEKREGRRPQLIATAARSPRNREVTSYHELHAQLWAQSEPILILFGTGHGLADEILARADQLLAPIEGTGAYNHLSVRAAAAIVLDRLLGARDR